jgi:aspartyl-tRNA(Asn)/glutamyl-tRNA(Gln) amidotransferase subunit A
MKDRSPQRLWQLSATELAAAYGAGTITPDAVLEVTLERLAEVNPRINAVVALDLDGARTAARESARRWRDGLALGPLDGVPVTIKDNILARGLRATWGSRLYAEYVPELDEEPVARLRNAGAVILGKTNVPEFTLHGFTDNVLFGPTRNPWDLALTPGGSSGGAAAAVASGIGPIALCTDGGGSIRRPAAHTGLVGFKPSRGMVPRDTGFPAILYDFEVAGPIARNVDDIVLAMRVMGGPQWRELSDPPHDRRLKILHIAAFRDEPVDPTIGRAVADVAAKFGNAGHHVEHALRFDLARPIGEIWPIISSSGVAWLLAQHDGAENKVGPALAEMARQGATYSAADYLGALDAIQKLKREFDTLFERIDVLLTPTTAAMPWLATETHPTVIAGQPVGPRGHAVFTPFANALGLPAISLPCHSWPDDAPIGFQLCAARGQDAVLLELAREYERQTETGFRWPPL